MNYLFGLLILYAVVLLFSIGFKDVNEKLTIQKFVRLMKTAFFATIIIITLHIGSRLMGCEGRSESEYERERRIYEEEQYRY